MKLYEVVEYNRDVFLVTEFCPGKNLKSMLKEQVEREKKSGQLTDDQKLFTQIRVFKIMRQLIDGLYETHSRGRHPLTQAL